MIISPAIVMILGGIMIPAVNQKARHVMVLGLPLIALWMIWQIDPGTSDKSMLAGFATIPVFVHSYTHIFATIFSLAAFAGGLFGLLQARRTELGAAYVYAGSAIGVTFAGDLLTMFVYWEIMAIGSLVVIWAGRSNKTYRAGLRYAYMHFIGGVILLCGISVQILNAGDNSIARFISGDKDNLAHILIMIGVLVNIAAPPFSAWLPDAYPTSSPFGGVFLSAFTTKTAVFVLLTLFAGKEILIYIGLFMIFYGIIYAMLENDIRRILSYSIVNQVGFMVTGIGIGTDLALAGVAAHAFCHIIYKALLFMSAGSVIFMTGHQRCTDLGGLHHSMRITAFCGIVGAMAISAFPLTSGFVSKSIISAAAAQEHLAYVWFLLLAASAGVFLHAGIKFPWFVFFAKDSGLRPKDPPLNMKLGMLFLVAGCFLPAIFPQQFYDMLLPGKVDYVPYTSEHVVTQLELLLFSGLAFFVMLPFLQRTITISLDLDWFYRVLFMKILLMLEKAGYGLLAVIREAWSAIWKRLFGGIYSLHGPTGIAARNWGIATTALTTTALLGLLLIIYYFGR